VLGPGDIGQAGEDHVAVIDVALGAEQPRSLLVKCAAAALVAVIVRLEAELEQVSVFRIGLVEVENTAPKCSFQQSRLHRRLAILQVCRGTSCRERVSRSKQAFRDYRCIPRPAGAFKSCHSDIDLAQREPIFPREQRRQVPVRSDCRRGLTGVGGEARRQGLGRRVSARPAAHREADHARYHRCPCALKKITPCRHVLVGTIKNFFGLEDARKLPLLHPFSSFCRSCDRLEQRSSCEFAKPQGQTAAT
jgi:hypothetical protein